jgi:hypothetical protein
MEIEKTTVITMFALFAIGLLLGLLGAFVFISMPLTDIYLTKYNELTKNDTLKCFDSTNMTNPIMVDKLKLRDFCEANYCSDIPLIGQMPDVPR